MCAAIIRKVRKRFSIKCFQRNLILANHNKGKCAISQSDLGANTGRSGQTPRARVRCPLTLPAQNHILTQKPKILAHKQAFFHRSNQSRIAFHSNLDRSVYITDVTQITGPEKFSALSRGKGKNGLHFKEKQVQTRNRFPQSIENRSSSQINQTTRDYP